MAELTVFNIDGKKAGKVDLPDETFTGRVNVSLIHQAVLMYRAALRQGNASTKIRKEVSGGGKKPWAQKGTGRARAGSSRSPLWHKGGVTFGPRPRDFSYSIPQKMKAAAFRESLKAKYQGEKILCLEDITMDLKKTKEFAAVMKKIGLGQGKVLALLDGSDTSIQRVSRNLPKFNLMRSQDVNAYDIMRNKTLLVSRTAITKLLERIGG